MSKSAPQTFGDYLRLINDAEYLSQTAEESLKKLRELNAPSFLIQWRARHAFERRRRLTRLKKKLAILRLLNAIFGNPKDCT